jgi:aryl-alcohol dehydrogenase-like predicted oxidoreductase
MAYIRKRILGTTDIRVSELGFGCASYWGRPAFAEDEALRLVRTAVELGVTFFDTGSSYAGGEAEPRLGRALKGLDVEHLVIASKAGTYAAGGGRIARDFTPAAIRRSVEQSLKRLGLAQLDILNLHGPDRSELTPELIGVLEDLKAQEKIRAWGVNSFDPATIDHAIGIPELDCVMLDYNLLRPEREPLITRCWKAGKGVLAGMPLAMGHTAPTLGRLKGAQDLWYAARGVARHREEMSRGGRFRFLHQQTDLTGSQAALGYVLMNPRVASAVFGTTRVDHLRENVKASGMTLPAALLARIGAAQSLI